MKERKHAKGIELDTESTVADLKDLVKRFKAAVKKQTNKDFPACAWEQLLKAVMAMFDSWTNPRANYYRRLNNIPEVWGAAVNVQALLFGNMGDTSDRKS